MMLPRPTILKRCLRCKVAPDDVDAVAYVIVSPSGTAHYGLDSGDTLCGIDATGEHWWWPA